MSTFGALTLASTVFVRTALGSRRFNMAMRTARRWGRSRSPTHPYAGDCGSGSWPLQSRTRAFSGRLLDCSVGDKPLKARMRDCMRGQQCVCHVSLRAQMVSVLRSAPDSRVAAAPQSARFAAAIVVWLCAGWSAMARLPVRKKLRSARLTGLRGERVGFARGVHKGLAVWLYLRVSCIVMRERIPLSTRLIAVWPYRSTLCRPRNLGLPGARVRFAYRRNGGGALFQTRGELVHVLL